MRKFVESLQTFEIKLNIPIFT